jgi:hypothetical protein
MLTDEEVETKCLEIESRFEVQSKLEAEDEQPPNVLYHYTSAEGILGIVETGQLWATNVLYLNDASELSGARVILNSELESAPSKLFWPLRYVTGHAERLAIDHFVASFCEGGDLLSQWRAYGSQGNGYSVGFHASALLATVQRAENNFRGACTLRKVRYRRGQKTEMIQKRIAILSEILEPIAPELGVPEKGYFKPAEQLAKIFEKIAASIHPALALMKHEAFEAEGEWRLVRTLWKTPVPIADSAIRVRTIGGRLAPYLPISWVLPQTPGSKETQSVKEIYCGPSVDPELKQKAIRDLLSWKNLTANVSLSKVPLRA